MKFVSYACRVVQDNTVAWNLMQQRLTILLKSNAELAGVKIQMQGALGAIQPVLIVCAPAKSCMDIALW